LSEEIRTTELPPRDPTTGQFTTDQFTTSTADPFQGEQPLPLSDFKEMPRVQPAEKPDSFGSDKDGLKSAAQELVRKRQEAEQNAPVIERAYHTDANADKPRRPLNETVKLREAAEDLSSVRQGEADRDEVLKNLSLRERLDRFLKDSDADGVSAQAVPQPQPEQNRTDCANKRRRSRGRETNKRQSQAP
jgi:hypothetical protein